MCRNTLRNAQHTVHCARFISAKPTTQRTKKNEPTHFLNHSSRLFSVSFSGKHNEFHTYTHTESVSAKMAPTVGNSARIATLTRETMHRKVLLKLENPETNLHCECVGANRRFQLIHQCESGCRNKASNSSVHPSQPALALFIDCRNQDTRVKGQRCSGVMQYNGFQLTIALRFHAQF